MRPCLAVVIALVVGCHPPGWGKDDDPKVDGGAAAVHGAFGGRRDVVGIGRLVPKALLIRPGTVAVEHF